jgi:molybdopterin converting factor subunit 1
MTTVNVRLYAGLKDAAGARDICIELSDRATVAELRDALGARYPLVGALLPNVVYAVDEEYVSVDHALSDGDRVAVIPPVSGGR